MHIAGFRSRDVLGKAKATVKEIKTLSGLEEKEVQKLAKSGQEGT